MILLHAFAQQLRNGMPNPKNYPWWPELLALLGRRDVVQVGLTGEAALVSDFRAGLSLGELRGLVEQCDFWLAVDSFLPHLAHLVPKPGVVLWGPSDPRLFGYDENLNLLRSRDRLRKKQFRVWEEQSANADDFLPAADAAEQIQHWLRAEPLHLVGRSA